MAIYSRLSPAKYGAAVFVPATAKANPLVRLTSARGQPFGNARRLSFVQSVTVSGMPEISAASRGNLWQTDRIRLHFFRTRFGLRLLSRRRLCEHCLGGIFPYLYSTRVARITLVSYSMSSIPLLYGPIFGRSSWHDAGCLTRYRCHLVQNRPSIGPF